jgi:hypothetical protein
MPSNFSAFFVPKQKGGLSYNSKEQIALSLKIREGRSGLDEKDLERLVKASIFLPESIYDLQHHVCHIGAILGIVFGKESFLALQAEAFLNHIKQHESAYEEVFEKDNLNPSKILYRFDHMMQLFVREARKGNFCPNLIDIEDGFDSIYKYKKFSGDLPEQMTPAKKRASEAGPAEPNKKQKGSPSNVLSF